MDWQSILNHFFANSLPKVVLHDDKKTHLIYKFKMDVSALSQITAIL